MVLLFPRERMSLVQPGLLLDSLCRGLRAKQAVKTEEEEGSSSRRESDMTYVGTGFPAVYVHPPYQHRRYDHYPSHPSFGPHSSPSLLFHLLGNLLRTESTAPERKKRKFGPRDIRLGQLSSRLFVSSHRQGRGSS